MLLLPFIKINIMTRFVKVELKSGKKITVSESEIPGLRKAGLLKEDKQTGETKEFKVVGETKQVEKITHPKKRPANIGSHSIKGNRPKKT